MLGCDSGLPPTTRDTIGSVGNDFESLPAREGLSSAVYVNSKNLTAFSRGLWPESTEKTLGLEREVEREPQNSSIPVPRFQRGAGVLDHTDGTYSHAGEIDYRRFPISEMHLWKFPDSVEFQNWRGNFKTEICSKTADLHFTMQWVKEIEIAKSIDELMTSRSIVWRTDFPDYDMLVAMLRLHWRSFSTSTCSSAGH